MDDRWNQCLHVDQAGSMPVFIRMFMTMNHSQLSASSIPRVNVRVHDIIQVNCFTAPFTVSTWSRSQNELDFDRAGHETHFDAQ